MNQIVEFAGGPLDGYEHVLPDHSGELAGTVGLEINRNVVRTLSGEGDGDSPVGPPTSIAVYCLEEFSDPPRYEFLCAFPVDALEFDDVYNTPERRSRISGR